MDELKPCPFCGNTDVKNEHFPSDAIWCRDCHTVTSNVDRWQSRPIEDALRGEVERLTAEIERLRGEGWISVKDRLPKHHEVVYAWDESGYGDLAYYDTEVKHWHWDERFYTCPTITHWRPLPPAPEVPHA